MSSMKPSAMILGHVKSCFAVKIIHKSDKAKGDDATTILAELHFINFKTGHFILSNSKTSPSVDHIRRCNQKL